MVPGSWVRVYGVKHVNIRLAEKSGIDTLFMYDKHIRKTERRSVILLGRVIVAEDSGTLMGWLWWDLFRDNMLFMKNLDKFLEL